MNICRTEYPRPQFERSDWINLNGEWQFEIDNSESGKERGLFKTDSMLSGKINVPFCPESVLSGVNNIDFMRGVWYKRSFVLSDKEICGRIILHFGAVDYFCTAYINGKAAGEHKGGYSSFSFDVTGLVKPGENQITVYASDDSRNRFIPSGKQSELYYSHDCMYTRTTGIWQTVWLEFKPDINIESVRYYPDITGKVTIMSKLCGAADMRIKIFYDGRLVGEKNFYSEGGVEITCIKLDEVHLWEVGHGRLYQVELLYGSDKVKSYFGLRTIRLDNKKFLINEKSVFQRLVLDQGYYPDGLYTAPSDRDLERDIELSMAMGFNGARLHQKVFEERFLYHCDKKGYIVWGEYASWGLDHTDKNAVYSFLPEWMEIISRDFNHPSIIGWCPYNETWDIDGKAQADENLSIMYEVTKNIDPTRPCIDTSGNYHVKTDIFDVHDYEQDPEIFASHYNKLTDENIIIDRFCKRQTYRGEPFFVSEYGGILWSNNGGWGYGSAPETRQKFIERFKGLADALLDNPSVFGLCYTQLTDVEQEQNGLYTYERVPKFSPEKINKILTRPAAIEEETKKYPIFQRYSFQHE